jgi:hypothetical protein
VEEVLHITKLEQVALRLMVVVLDQTPELRQMGLQTQVAVAVEFPHL